MKRLGKTLVGIFLFVIFLGNSMSEAAPRHLRSVWGNGIQNVDLADAAAALHCSLRQSPSQVTLIQGINRLIFYPDKRYAFFNGIRVNLCYPVLVRRGRLYIGKADCENVLTPFLSPGTLYRHSISRIVLDPGHGGRDQGTIGLHLQEKTVTLNLAKRVAEILRVYGYNVTLTRTRDVWLPLDARSAFANRIKADLFVSIHANAVADHSVHGIETFCMTPEGAASSNNGKPVSKHYPGNRNGLRNFLLAYRVQRTVLKRTGAADSGVKFARFAVLRELNCPGVLIEAGFLSNRKEEANLRNSAYLDNVARGIAAGILNYHRSLAR